MKQMKVALPDDLRARLDNASKKSGRSVAEEIRSRVEASLARDAVADTATRDLVEGVALMAAEIERETGAAWHKHAGAHETLEWAIKFRLRELKPKGSVAFSPRPHRTLPYDDPYQLGPIIEFRLRRYPNFTGSSTRRHMEEEHQRWQQTGSPLTEEERQRLGITLPPPLDTPQQQRKPDQPKKRGK